MEAKAQVKQIKWEYKRERSNNIEHLNLLGAEGWEIITQEGNNVLMKRPKN